MFMLPRICRTDSYSCCSNHAASPSRRVVTCPTPFFSNAEQSCTQSAPVIMALTASSTEWTPPLAAREQVTFAGYDGEPSQPEQELTRIGEMEPRDGLQVFDVKVGLVKPVQQDQAVGPCRLQVAGKVRQRGVKGRELHAHGNAARFSSLSSTRR